MVAKSKKFPAQCQRNGVSRAKRCKTSLREKRSVKDSERQRTVWKMRPAVKVKKALFGTNTLRTSPEALKSVSIMYVCPVLAGIVLQLNRMSLRMVQRGWQCPS